MDAESDDLFSPQSSDCESEEELGPISYAKFLELKKSGHTSRWIHPADQRHLLFGRRHFSPRTEEIERSNEDIDPQKALRRAGKPHKLKMQPRTKLRLLQNPVRVEPLHLLKVRMK